jgi:hypothetical protein
MLKSIETDLDDLLPVKADRLKIKTPPHTRQGSWKVYPTSHIDKPPMQNIGGQVHGNVLLNTLPVKPDTYRAWSPMGGSEFS